MSIRLSKDSVISTDAAEGMTDKAKLRSRKGSYIMEAAVVLPVIIFVLITMGVIFFGKITRLDNLNAEKIAGIILVSPPYKKRITGQQKIEEFTILFNDRKKKPVFSITPPKWPGQRSHYINGNIPI